jgi:cellulose synthase operon protein C
MKTSKFFIASFLTIASAYLPAAFAQNKQGSKKQTVGEMISKIENEKGANQQLQNKGSAALPTAVDTMAAERNKKPNVNLQQVKPPKATEMFREEKGDRAELERIADQQIQELYSMTQRFKNSPNRGELWLRLAELYVEKANLLNMKKQELFDQQIKLYNEGKLKTRPQFESSDAKEYNRKAVQLYEWFQRDFPKDEKMDQALFFLGFNSFELGETQKGVNYYTRLTQEFPKSSYVSEAYFSLGEFYFENERWNEAYKNYLETMKDRKHRLFNFALYKGAWCLFRTGQQEKGLRSLELLIKNSRLQAKGNAGKLKIESEGMRDIVVFYADVGRPETAFQYFKDLAGEEYINYVEKLAYFYSDRGDKDKALYLFKDLIRTKPTTPKAFEFQYQIILSFSNSKDTEKFRNELFGWIRDYGLQSEWYRVNKDNKEFVDNSFKLREYTLRNWVMQNHQTAQNSRAPFSQKMAYDGYKLYLGEFAGAQQYADMKFYFAELLYDMKLYAEAADNYKWTAVNAPTSKHINAAYLNTVLSTEKMLPSDAELSKKAGNSTAPIPLDPIVDNFVKTVTWYLAKYPEAEKNIEIKFRMGRIYYQYNQFDSAVTIFKEIVQKYPKSSYAEFSANLMLDIFNLKKDYAALEKSGAELLALPAFAGTKAGAEIKDVIEKAGFKKAQELEGTNDYAKAASQFEAFARANPSSGLAAIALFNAAINYERATQPAKALAAHKSFLTTTDKALAANRQQSARIVAKLYQDAGMLEEASLAYYVAAQAAAKDANQSSLFFNSAILFDGLNSVDKAAQAYNEYLRTEVKPEKIDALYRMAEMYRRNGRWPEAMERYKDYLKNNPTDVLKTVDAHYYIYQGLLASGRAVEAEQARQKLIQTQKRLVPDGKGAGASYIAKFRLTEAERKYDQFRAIQIPADPAQMQSAVQKKIGSLGELNTIVVDVIRYDSADEIVGALTILGLANFQMNDSLINAPLPAGLTDEESKQYRDGIAKLAEPFAKKSADGFKAAVEKARSLESYNEYYLISLRNLVRIDPKSAYEGGELAIESRSYDWMGLQ